MMKVARETQSTIFYHSKFYKWGSEYKNMDMEMDQNQQQRWIQKLPAMQEKQAWQQ